MGMVSRHPHHTAHSQFSSDVIRREISPSSIQVGQIAQVKMSFRLLKQENGTFSYREMLKGVCVLHEGLSMVRPLDKVVPCYEHLCC